MNAIVLAVASAALGYLLDALLVGAVLSAVRRRSGASLSNRRAWVGLLVVFALLDLYWIPAAVALDLKFVIGNPDAAAVLGSTHHATEAFPFGWFEILVWLAQVLVAIWIAERLSASTDAI